MTYDLCAAPPQRPIHQIRHTHTYAQTLEGRRMASPTPSSTSAYPNRWPPQASPTLGWANLGARRDRPPCRGFHRPTTLSLRLNMTPVFRISDPTLWVCRRAWRVMCQLSSKLSAAHLSRQTRPACEGVAYLLGKTRNSQHPNLANRVGCHSIPEEELVMRWGW